VIARLRNLLSQIGATFWLLPGFMVLGSVWAAIGLVQVDRDNLIPRYLLAGPWLYNGAATGARTLLGAVASSTIGVAGTVFSITIAALSLAAGQMGPRLLHNFVRDRGNQFVLGAFLGTFSYALTVLRSIRAQGEGEFVPHLALSIAILLALICVATLVYFVGHMAGRINVDTVIDLVSTDIHSAIRRLTTQEQQPEAPPSSYWRGATPIRDSRHGYLLQLDECGLANWAMQNRTAILLLARPGGFVFPGAPIAMMTNPAEGADLALRNATALGPQRGSAADLEFDIRQLVEVAVRALSPGINDPHTAISVLDHLGAALCEIAPVNLASGVILHEGNAVLVVPCVDYDGLSDSMFHMIRQNAAGNAAVLIRMLEVLTAVARCDRKPERLRALRRHADLVFEDAARDISTPADLQDVRDRRALFESACKDGCGALVPQQNQEWLLSRSSPLR